MVRLDSLDGDLESNDLGHSPSTEGQASQTREKVSAALHQESPSYGKNQRRHEDGGLVDDLL